MSTSHQMLKFLRKIHLYVGIFISPALLFFSFTGAVQTFNLHETTQGSSYTPPRWLVVLGQLHKKQTTDMPVRRPRLPSVIESAPPDRQSAQNSTQPKRSMEAPAPAPAPKRHLPMKIFFLLVAVGLAISTLTGIYMALKYSRPVLVLALLFAGFVAPLILLAL
jgi:hypothetical protein